MGLGWGIMAGVGVAGRSPKGIPGAPKCPLKGKPAPGWENKLCGPTDMGPLGDMSGECWCMEDGGGSRGRGGTCASAAPFLAASIARATSSKLLCCMGGGGILKMVCSPGLQCVDM